MKNMHHHIAVIGDDPMARRKPIDGVGADAVLFVQALADFPDDRLDVRFAGAGANDEKIGEARQAAQIERDDALGFFVRGGGRAELG
jgi:hypothetical protein